MNELVLITKIQKILRDNFQQISNVMVGGGVDNMEKYKYMLGQAQAYKFISGEISNLLNKGAKDEDKNGTVVNLDGKDRNPKA